ncbi:DUF421 domain-containing protein [Pseudomonas lopnurensis]|uniref:DUF421 domain-containing protein n=1 Tax=Pseudomonas lopnurensis TaxID=1477517 RepID=UPI0018799E7C|nr:YetF domain-containing protein [Pseudomonas lopnurensis]MBE7377016.1 DUF421 domain-containing protein [Pseudomonas lopnurensis]
MDSVLRAAAIYLILLVLFRIAGRRTLSEITNFDFVLLLIIGEATQQALLGDDFSITNATLVICSLVMMNILFSLIKQWSPTVAKYLDGEPMILVEYGKTIKSRLVRARVDESDILEAARSTQGLESINQIKFAILEKDGKISIIPQS